MWTRTRIPRAGLIDGVASQTPVVVGIAQGNLIAVTGDLEPGDLVVVRGAERLRDGQKVKVLGQLSKKAGPDG